MGENITIYFDDECMELIGSITGRGTLINQLIKDHFRNDMDYLIRDRDKAARTLAAIESEISAKRKEFEMKKAKDLEVKKSSSSETKRKALLERLDEIWRANAITDEEYYSCFDKDKMNEDRAKKMIDKLKQLENVND